MNRKEGVGAGRVSAAPWQIWGPVGTTPSGLRSETPQEADQLVASPSHQGPGSWETQDPPFGLHVQSPGSQRPRRCLLNAQGRRTQTHTPLGSNLTSTFPAEDHTSLCQEFSQNKLPETHSDGGKHASTQGKCTGRLVSRSRLGLGTAQRHAQTRFLESESCGLAEKNAGIQLTIRSKAAGSISITWLY